MRSESVVRVWRAPILLGLLSAVGLVAALLSDGVGDVVGWAALAVPVGVSAWCASPFAWRSRRTSTS